MKPSALVIEDVKSRDIPFFFETDVLNLFVDGSASYLSEYVRETIRHVP